MIIDFSGGSFGVSLYDFGGGSAHAPVRGCVHTSDRELFSIEASDRALTDLQTNDFALSLVTADDESC